MRNLLQSRRNKLYIVHLLVNNTPVSCLLDTGAELSIIDTNMLIRLQLPYVNVPIRLQGAQTEMKQRALGIVKDT